MSPPGSGLFLCGVGDLAHKEQAAGGLVVDDEEEGPVEGQSRWRCGERPASRDAAVRNVLIHCDDRFMMNLTAKRSERRTLYNHVGNRTR